MPYSSCWGAETMTSPGPDSLSDLHSAFSDPGTHHLICGTNTLLILWFN